MDSSDRVAATAHAIPLPRDRCDIGLGAAVLLTVDERPKAEARALARGYGLTKAECEVAALLLLGWRMARIAHHRQVSNETVRSQTKSVYSKLAVRGQLDLIGTFGPGAGR